MVGWGIFFKVMYYMCIMFEQLVVRENKSCDKSKKVVGTILKNSLQQ